MTEPLSPALKDSKSVPCPLSRFWCRLLKTKKNGGRAEEKAVQKNYAPTEREGAEERAKKTAKHLTPSGERKTFLNVFLAPGEPGKIIRCQIGKTAAAKNSKLFSSSAEKKGRVYCLHYLRGEKSERLLWKIYITIGRATSFLSKERGKIEKKSGSLKPEKRAGPFFPELYLVLPGRRKATERLYSANTISLTLILVYRKVM